MGNHHSDNEVSLITVNQQHSSKFHHNCEFVLEEDSDSQHHHYQYAAPSLRTPLKERKNVENIFVPTPKQLDDSKESTSVSRAINPKSKLAVTKIAYAQTRRCSIPSIFLRLNESKYGAKNGEQKRDSTSHKITKFVPSRHRSSTAILEHANNKNRREDEAVISKMPVIQINGVDESAASDAQEQQRKNRSASNASDKSVDQFQKPRAQKMDSRKVTAQRRLDRSQQQSQKRRLDYLVSNATIVARSLDDASGSHAHFATDLQRAMMKPLNVCHRNSPLKQMRTYSHRSVASEENLLTKEDGEEIRRSWKLANERLVQFSSGRCFGFYVLEKVLEKDVKLKAVFGIANSSIYDVPDTHSFSRHTRIFNSIIDLAVRNVDELETEIAPALFTYGRRHYQQALLDAFNEESVRMFCGEIVHTMLDLLGDSLTTEGFEAWIELVRYMGTALMNGFEYERLTNTKKISINTKQHAYFVL